MAAGRRWRSKSWDGCADRGSGRILNSNLKSVQAQIVEVADKVERTKFALGRPAARQDRIFDACAQKGLTGTQPPHSNSSDAWQSWWGWFKEDWRKFAMSLGFIASAVAAAASFNKDTNRSVEVLYQKLSNSLAEVKMKRQISHASRNYVSRPALESKILAVYDNILSRERDSLDHLWRQGRGQDIRSEPRSR